MTEEQKERLRSLADTFDAAPRFGALDAQDVPEGSRYVKVSDTLAGQISTLLREICE